MDLLPDQRLVRWHEPREGPDSHGYRLLRALRPRLSRFLNHGWTQMNTDHLKNGKSALSAVHYPYPSACIRGSRSFRRKADPKQISAMHYPCSSACIRGSHSFRHQADPKQISAMHYPCSSACIRRSHSFRRKADPKQIATVHHPCPSVCIRGSYPFRRQAEKSSKSNKNPWLT